jgi:uncharacterized membrane protein YagU involved in acid resistance
MCITCSDISEKSRSSNDKAGIARKSYFSFKSAFIAGAIATAAMTIFTFMASLMGFEMDIPKMLAGTMNAPIVVGWTAHFMIGEILAVSFAIVFLKKTNKSANLTSGAMFGLIPWLIAQVMVMPVMSIINGGSYAAGLFSASIIIAMASLIGHLIYGAVLGSIYKPKIATAIATI